MLESSLNKNFDWGLYLLTWFISNDLVSYFLSFQVSHLHMRKKNLPLYNIYIQVNSTKSGQEYKVRKGTRAGEGDLRPNKKNNSPLENSDPSSGQHGRFRDVRQDILSGMGIPVTVTAIQSRCLSWHTPSAK